MFDFILKGGTVFDGTGRMGFVADVGVRAGEVSYIHPSIETGAGKVIDCRGLAVTPGFIDCQNKSDRDGWLISQPGLDSMVLQGFTTVVIGNCGTSLAPLSSHGIQNQILGNADWQDFGEFVSVMQRLGFGCNVASYVGLSSLLFFLFGEVRSLNSGEIQILDAHLRRALEAGALGLSIGFPNAHQWIIAASIAGEISAALADYHGSLSVHLRDFGAEVVVSAQEALAFLSNPAIPIRLSHLKAEGRDNWGHLNHLVHLIETTGRSGPVGFDVYPYDFSYEPLKNFLPAWVDVGDLKQGLKKPEDRFRIGRFMEANFEDLPKLKIASTDFPMNLSGRILGDVAANWKTFVGEAALQILISGGNTLVFSQTLSQSQVENLCRHPLSAISSDGIGMGIESSRQRSFSLGTAHPRNFGTAPKFLHWSKSGLGLDLAKAIYKLTAWPAKLCGLSRGMLQEGKAADIVIFDPFKIRDRATPENPYLSPDGIAYVMVNGQLTVDEGRLVSGHNGVFIKRV